MRHNYLGITLFILVSSVCFQCSPTYNDNIENVLDNVGNKRADLEGVLVHYQLPADSLKRKAAYFLVENFPEDKYQTIDKQLLIENIELAFQVWKKPWAKQLTFDEFKELVLPFDLERDSTGTFWRKRFMDEYAFVEDSLIRYPNENPTIAACIIVNKKMKKKYRILAELGKTNPRSLYEWEKKRTGDCVGMAYFTNNLMHSIGIPTAVEFTPQWANQTDKHYWSSVFANKHFFSFVGAESNPRKCKIEIAYLSFIRKRPNVFRITYAINPLSLASQTDEEIPDIFNSTHFQNISKTTIPTQDLTLALPDSINDTYLYLSVFSRKTINGIAWGKRDDSKVQFSSVRPEAVYILSTYKHGEFSHTNYPFILQNDGQKRILKPQINSFESIICHKKYPVDSTNMVKIGDKYELLYWDQFGWKSLGSKVASEKKLTFDKVPKNALLLLTDLSRGRKERIFTYENSKQIFW